MNIEEEQFKTKHAQLKQANRKEMEGKEFVN